MPYVTYSRYVRQEKAKAFYCYYSFCCCVVTAVVFSLFASFSLLPNSSFRRGVYLGLRVAGPVALTYDIMKDTLRVIADPVFEAWLQPHALYVYSQGLKLAASKRPPRLQTEGWVRLPDHRFLGL